MENKTHYSITTIEITTQTVSPRLMPEAQYVYIQKFAKCFLIFENPFIILKSISFIFTNSISIYWSSFKVCVGILMILNRVYGKYFWIRFKCKRNNTMQIK